MMRTTNNREKGRAIIPLVVLDVYSKHFDSGFPLFGSAKGALERHRLSSRQVYVKKSQLRIGDKEMRRTSQQLASGETSDDESNVSDHLLVHKPAEA